MEKHQHQSSKVGSLEQTIHDSPDNTKIGSLEQTIIDSPDNTKMASLEQTSPDNTKIESRIESLEQTIHDSPDKTNIGSLEQTIDDTLKNEEPKEFQKAVESAQQVNSCVDVWWDYLNDCSKATPPHHCVLHDNCLDIMQFPRPAGYKVDPPSGEPIRNFHLKDYSKVPMSSIIAHRRTCIIYGSDSEDDSDDDCLSEEEMIRFQPSAEPIKKTACLDFPLRQFWYWQNPSILFTVGIIFYVLFVA